MDEIYPKISIVTPSYNQGIFLELAIQSVLRQNYSNFEHIIIDNCSTDETIKILKKYPHLIWKSEPDKGQSDALNKGFALAKGDIVGWLNADDKYLLGCFQEIIKFFNHYSESDIAYGDYRWIDEQGEVIQCRKELDFDFFMLKYLHILYIPTASTFFKRKIFDENNFLDTSLKYAMDYEFFLRLAMKGYKFTHLNSYLADYRWHENSKSTIALKEQRQEQEMSLLRHDNFLSQIPSSTQLIVRNFFKFLARAKRFLVKAVNGYYFGQWNTNSVKT